MNAKDAYIEHLENTIKDLQKQISSLTEMVMLLHKEKFGPSSEKTPKTQMEDQLSLFNHHHQLSWWFALPLEGAFTNLHLKMH